MDKTRNSVYVLCLVALLAFLWIGCESQLISTDWEGEYEMKTQVIAVYQDNTRDTIRTNLQTPFSIYKEKGKWYVATHYFGVPNADCEEPIRQLILPHRIQCKLDSVEDIVVNYSPVVIIENGLIFTYKAGVKYGSKPILITGCTPNSITFNRSEIFEVSSYDVKGEKSNISCVFDYKPINKIEDIFTYYSWEVNLIFDNTPFVSFKDQGIAGIKYQNILRKK